MMINDEGPCSIFNGGQKLNRKTPFSPPPLTRSEGTGINSLFMCKAEYKEENGSSFPKATKTHHEEEDDDDKSLSSDNDNNCITDKNVADKQRKSSPFLIKSEVTSSDDVITYRRKRSHDNSIAAQNQLHYKR